MEVGKKVKIKSGTRGRPRHGIVVELLWGEHPEDPMEVAVVTKNGRELFAANELEVIEEKND